MSARRDELLEVLAAHQVVIVAGETGSGKTTQLPKLLLEQGRGVRGQIACTQPRRLAARTVAQRIADELGVELGGEVGYGVRFDDRGSADTLVRLVTDGLLLAEIRHDPLLRRYDAIVVDEAHERSLNVDFLLGCLARILPRRPDLRVVITSATIETDRFSRHFGGAPVVEVSGRTYPVEIRYRPIGPVPIPGAGDEDEDEGAVPEDVAPVVDRDQPEAIADAVRELFAEGPGDVLVFLSGEREIRDTEEALAGLLDPAVEILPLYARLSNAEQQRVFRRSGGRATRRVVLATNVAETSLTVPGIRYVVDPGFARISRYSARLKVQRLPIEPISQASAAQRAGRCGRVADGVCIRLYAQADHDARPRFTDPEVLRTSLAAVILQMAALGLGDVEDFPFLDPPDRRQVRDGVLLLHELGAFADRRDGGGRELTEIGRRLARLPVDPRLGRMVLEADRLRCADEVVVLAAALSIQDPRERPLDGRERADQLHARFKDEHSDLTTWLNLWAYLQELRGELSRTRFRKRCKSEHLHHLRIREWQDLVAQLRGAAQEVGVRFGAEPAEPEPIHLAVLSGLLSHVGLKDARRKGEYLGARGARFRIFPGSVLARRGPTWVMVAELVETSQLFGRTADRIEPGWIEPLAGHLVSRTYSEPRWDARRGEVVATERVTLYGLPVVTGRTVSYAPVDPVLARELFLRRALVEGDWPSRHAFLAENRELVEEVEALEERSRRRGLLAGDDVLLAFFDERVPPEVTGGKLFDRWWREARAADPGRLTYPRELLLDRTALAELDPKAFPTAWKQGEHVLRLSYRFEPGAPDDGVTVHVPIGVLPEVRDVGFDWLVPGLRHELVVALVRGLPKELRRPLVPVPEAASAVLAAVTPRSEPLLGALEREFERLRGARIGRADWAPGKLPDHLRMRFVVEDPDGAVLAAGEDLGELRDALRPALRQRLAASAPQLTATGLRTFPADPLPEVVDVPGGRGYPALVDEGDTVGVRLLDTADAAAEAMRLGTRRLLLFGASGALRWVRDRLDLTTQVALANAPFGGLDAALADCAAAACDGLVVRHGGPARDAAAFATLRGHVLGELADETLTVVEQVVALAARREEVLVAITALGEAPAVAAARADLQAQLGRLVHAGSVGRAGTDRLPDLDRYLRAMLQRIARLRGNPAADAQKQSDLGVLERELEALRAAWPVDRGRPALLRELPWMLEELRVGLFAPGLGTRGTVSVKRVRAAIAEVERLR